MYLTQLDTPNEEQIRSIKDRILLILRKFGPEYIDEPVPEAVMTLGSSLYSDGHQAKRDYEKVENTWSESWDYQRFFTDAMTQREVWLPPKMYKACSSWWHFFAEPIIKQVPWIVSNDLISDVRKSVTKRMRPSVKIDLKGFGLQFPREYIVAAMEAILEVYPSEEGEEYKRSAISMFSKISIQMDDMRHIVPKRGVGLGYFSNLMTLVVGSLLAECDIVKMFNDDILCPEENYKRALELLTDHKFIINEKKTGGVWKKVPYFAGVLMTPQGSIEFYTRQGLRAAVHTGQHHFQRKAALLAVACNRRWLSNYHYERLYGYEIQPGEAFMHPSVLGLDPYAAKPVGWVRGGLLRMYKSPRQDDENTRRIWSMTYPWKDPREENFAKVRREAKKKKDIVWYTENYDYLHPEIRAKDGKPIRSDFFGGKYQLPQWADMQSIIARQVTCGRTTKGRNPRVAAYNMLDYLLAENPIQAWLQGGYEVDTGFHRIPGVTPDMLILYSRLRETVFGGYNSVQKTEGKGSLLVLKKGSGIDFLKESEKLSDGTFEFQLDITHDFVEETEDIMDLMVDDDASIAFISEGEESSEEDI